MPGEQLGKFKPFLTVVGNAFRQKVDADTAGARKRVYEIRGVKGEKHELVFKNWTGVIRGMSVRDTAFEEQLVVEFDDAFITFNTQSRFFSDFAKKIRGIDTKKQVTLSPYDFKTDEGKRMMGITVMQDGEKKRNYFWDEKKGKPVKEFPAPTGDVKKYKGDDWTMYYLGVKKFLLEEIQKLEFEPAKDEEINLDKVPF